MFKVDCIANNQNFILFIFEIIFELEIIYKYMNLLIKFNKKKRAEK